LDCVEIAFTCGKFPHSICCDRNTNVELALRQPSDELRTLYPLLSITTNTGDSLGPNDDRGSKTS
jgi:hypothetical protein